MMLLLSLLFRPRLRRTGAVLAVAALCLAVAAGRPSPVVAAGPFAFIPNEPTGTVSVIDTATNTVVGSPIAVQPLPVLTAVHPSGLTVYIGHRGPTSEQHNISVLNAISRTVTAVIAVPSSVGALLVNPAGTRLYVAGGNGISIYDTANNSLVGSPINIGGYPDDLAINPAGTRLYVPSSGSQGTRIIDLTTNTVLGNLNLGAYEKSAGDLVVSPSGARAWVMLAAAQGRLGTGGVLEVDLTTNAVIGAPIPLPGDTQNIIMTPNGQRLYVSHWENGGAVSVIDTTTKQLIASITLPGSFSGATGAYAIDVTPDGSRVYVNQRGGTKVFAIATTTNTLIGAGISVPSDFYSRGTFITPPTAPQLVFSTHPGGAAAGSTFGTQPVVQARDADDSVDTTFNGSVTVSITPGTGTAGAVLGGTKTVNAVNGVASFTNLSINRAGTNYSLTATASGLPSGISASFAVLAANVKAEITSPVPGSVLPGSTVIFQWSAGTSAQEYYLLVGTVPGGSSNIYGGSQGLATSRTVSGIPTSGSSVYVRLWTRFVNGWQQNDYSFRTGSGIEEKAQITSPTPGSVLPGSSVTFQWSTGQGASEYFLLVGSTPGGSYDIYGDGQGLATSRTVNGLPTNGSMVYVRLWTRFASGWQQNDYQFTASSVGGLVAMPTGPRNPGPVVDPSPSTSPKPTASPVPTLMPTRIPSPTPASGLQPMTVSGVVRVGGQPAVKQVVQAVISGVVCGQATTGTDGAYQMSVSSTSQQAGCGTNGAAVTFRIGGIAASGNATFASGGAAAVNLSR